VVETSTKRGERLERLRLPSATIERDHRLPVKPLAQGVLGGESENLAERLRVPTERELRFDPLLERGQPQLLEALDLGLQNPCTRGRRTRDRPRASSFAGRRAPGWFLRADG
jgi:hypothetical protein